MISCLFLATSTFLFNLINFSFELLGLSSYLFYKAVLIANDKIRCYVHKNKASHHDEDINNYCEWLAVKQIKIDNGHERMYR